MPNRDLDTALQIETLDVDLGVLMTFCNNLKSGFIGETQWAQNAFLDERFSQLFEYLNASLGLVDSRNSVAAFALLRPALELVLSDILSFRFSYQLTRKKFDKSKDAKAFLHSKEAKTLLESSAILELNESDHTEVFCLLPVWASTESVTPSERLPAARYELVMQLWDFEAGINLEHFRSKLFAFHGDDGTKFRTKRIYENELKWNSICRQLLMCGWASSEGIELISIHYHFLSKFTHPIVDPIKIIRGTNHPEAAWSIENERILVRLYAYYLITQQLQTFIAYVTLQDKLQHRDLVSAQEVLDSSQLKKIIDILQMPGALPTNRDLAEQADYERQTKAQEEFIEAATDVIGYLRYDDRPHVYLNLFERISKFRVIFESEEDAT